VAHRRSGIADEKSPVTEPAPQRPARQHNPAPHNSAPHNSVQHRPLDGHHVVSADKWGDLKRQYRARHPLLDVAIVATPSSDGQARA
jgi:hypothetical protein